MALTPEQKERKRAWYQKHADQERAKARPRALARYYANRTKMLAAQREWRETHPEQYRAEMKARTLKHQEKNRIRARAWYAANKEKAKARIRAWGRDNPENQQLYSTRKRSRKLAAPICDFTRSQWEAMRAAANGRCHYCGLPARLTIDHKQALADGGSHTEANIVPACRSCNSRKHTTPYEEYLRVANG